MTQYRVRIILEQTEDYLEWKEVQSFRLIENWLLGEQYNTPEHFKQFCLNQSYL